MTKVDVKFSARKAANLKRKAPATSTSRQPASNQSEVSSDEEDESPSQEPEEEEKDEGSLLLVSMSSRYSSSATRPLSGRSASAGGRGKARRPPLSLKRRL